MSTIEPRETKVLKPMSWLTAQSKTAVPSAPLCERKVTLPGFGTRLEKVAFKFVEGLITPIQLGPMIWILFLRAISLPIRLNLRRWE